MVKYGGDAELESSTKPNSRLKHLTHFKYSDHANEIWSDAAFRKRQTAKINEMKYVKHI